MMKLSNLSKRLAKPSSAPQKPTTTARSRTGTPPSSSVLSIHPHATSYSLLLSLQHLLSSSTVTNSPLSKPSSQPSSKRPPPPPPAKPRNPPTNTSSTAPSSNTSVPPQNPRSTVAAACTAPLARTGTTRRMAHTATSGRAP
jgi:hypothetical protein